MSTAARRSAEQGPKGAAPCDWPAADTCGISSASQSKEAVE
jgi:hypothetical protein